MNTELRAAFLGALERGLPTARPAVDLAVLLGAARDAVRAVVLAVIHELSDPVPASLAVAAPHTLPRPPTPSVPLHPSK